MESAPDLSLPEPRFPPLDNEDPSQQGEEEEGAG